jgi:hypothetical protein
MAGIDKTYTDDYNEYKKFKDWANNQKVEFFDGTNECIGDWVWDYEKEDFENGEIPIMNTPTWLDMYLIKNCKVKFVLDRMHGVHTFNFINCAKSVDFKQIPEGYEKNRKIVIKSIPKQTKLSLVNKSSSEFGWWLQQAWDNKKFYMEFNEETNRWVDSNKQIYPSNTNTSHHNTVKGLVRFLRKQYLPKGVEFNLIGRYVGEIYKITIK